MNRPLAIEFFSWWYGAGWVLAFRGAQKRFVKTSRTFSVPILLRTLFAPWKRIISYPGAGLDAHMRAMVDNIFSRAVGFWVRAIVLLTAFIMLAAVGVVALAEVIIWPLLPLAVPVFIILGFVI